LNITGFTLINNGFRPSTYLNQYNILMFSTILLIDDDNPTNYLHRFYLEEWNICQSVHVALDGREALTLIQQNPAIFKSPNSLILLDINMPVMNGFEFLQAYSLLEENQKADGVFVMLTTTLSEAYQQRANSMSEISGFIKKPVVQEELLSKAHSSPRR